MRLWRKLQERASSALEAVVETVKLAILLAVPPWPVPRGAPPRPIYRSDAINPEVTLDAEGARKVEALLDNPPAPNEALEELFKDKP